ncbi:MAG: AAA family ATPase [Candidatus Micrarchaeaceae archaeon]
MTKLILFVGTPGAGKSTILEGLKAQKKDLLVVNLGDELLQIAKDKRGITDREQLGTMTEEDIKRDREEAFANIIARKKDTIIDTHLTIKYGRRYIPGVTIKELEHIRIKAIVYIDATAKEIWERRHNDKSKQGRRNINDTEAEIDEQRNINLAILSSCAIYLSIPIYIIYNREGKQAEAMAELDKIVKEHFGI